MQKISVLVFITGLLFMFSCSSSTGSDSNAPTITITQPQNNETINDSIYTIQVSADDSKSIVSLKLYIDSLLVKDTAGKTDCQYDWHTYWWTESSDHTIKVEALDSDDNTTIKSVEVTLSDQAYITPKLMSPPDNATILNPVDFSWTAIPQASSYEIHITINDTPFINTSFTTTYSNSFLIYGSGTWQVKAQNGIGMETKLSEVFHFTLTEN